MCCPFQGRRLTEITTHKERHRIRQRIQRDSSKCSPEVFLQCRPGQQGGRGGAPAWRLMVQPISEAQEVRYTATRMQHRGYTHGTHLERWRDDHRSGRTGPHATAFVQQGGSHRRVRDPFHVEPNHLVRLRGLGLVACVIEKEIGTDCEGNSQLEPRHLCCSAYLRRLSSSAAEQQQTF